MIKDPKRSIRDFHMLAELRSSKSVTENLNLYMISISRKL